MKTTVELDAELVAQVERTSSLLHEQPDTVLCLAIQAGLRLVASRFESQRPENYFAEDYPLPGDRLELEAAMAKTRQEPDR